METIQMEKVKKLVPELRFKGFDEGWNLHKLGELGTFKNGLNKDSSEFGHGSPFVNLMDVFGKSILTESNFGLVNSNEKDKENYNLIKGDVLFIRSSVKRTGVGETILVANDVPNTVYSGFLIRFRDRNKELGLNFKSYCFSNAPFRKELLSYATSSANTNINQESLAQIKLYFPALPEQQKIASFLSAVDEKIQQLTRKKELLEQYKKGVMQQLFSGKLRFKDDTSTELSARNGMSFPDWEEKKLGDVCVKKSSNIAANKIEENFGDYVIYGASGILKKVDFYKEENNYISIVKDGAGVGRLLFCKGKSSVLGTMEMIIPKKGIDTYFLYSLLSNIDFVKYMTGSTIPHIYFKDYSSESCGIPCLEEQQKIANFLSSIDAKIDSAIQQLTQTQTFKKGLLQKMFV